MKTVWQAKKQDIINHIAYSGADNYPWFRNLSVNTNGSIICEMATEDDDNSPVVVAKFSPTYAKEVVNTIIKEKKTGWKTVQDAVENDDFDSNASDIVLQHIVLGDLVFG